ncbi:stringent starvation protein A [Aquimixticola soesokkakensis]|uniref:Stringent starvation protein A n=1 Tax=Aquimixticola soesokkakensis TaxID=1519096 RepID=A0A1Y5R624_9RHOB|nr:glutathione S-transferase [Aquimixticola soesokkakensis]SLN09953.1 stringent starvation protein A [Aquimixticola soesokkakensis]
MSTLPILYSFRRCPYAMRARLALASAGVAVELREVVLRDKPAELIAASPKATVPVLVIGPQVIDESRDIMDWALAQNDPEGWRDMPAAGHDWIAQIDGPFKQALDRYKYETRYEGVIALDERAKAVDILQQVDAALRDSDWLFGARPCLADMATLTFVRQFAQVDRAWFDAQGWDGVKRWLDAFVTSERFAAIMGKYPKWQAGDAPTRFGP